MDEYFVVHLEDDENDRKNFKNVFPDIKASILSSFTNYFAYPEENSNKKNKKPEIKLIQYKCVKSFCEGLFNQTGELSEVGKNTLIFFLDYYIKDDQPHEELESKFCYKNKFMHSLKKLFSVVPIIIITHHSAFEVSHSKYFLHKDDINNKAEFIRKLKQFMDKWWRPVFSSALEEYCLETGSESWHTPGHNAGNAFLRSNFQKSFYEFFGHNSFGADLSVSVDFLGDLSEPEKKSPMSAAMEKSAEIFGAQKTFYITNGTSTSNKAMLMTLLVPGEVVLLDRNCHKSVHQAIVMSGALPVYLSPGYNENLGIYAPVSRSKIIEALERKYDEKSKPRMLILTTCTYEGIIYPIEEISYYCEINGIIFYADEAWAPYLRFHPSYNIKDDGEIFCRSAMDGGAHFAVQSTHKALAAFSQASMIHISKKFEILVNENKSEEWNWLRERFSFKEGINFNKFLHDLFEKLRYWHSTSPHYPMIASLDRSGIQMRLEGMYLLNERLEWVKKLKEQLVAAGIPPNCFVELGDIVGYNNIEDYKGYYKDPLKLILRCNDSQALKEFKSKCESNHLQWEKSTRGSIEFLVTIGTTKGNIEQLAKIILDNKGLFDSVGGNSENVNLNYTLTEENISMQPYTAVNNPGILKQIGECENKICGQMVAPYPPGIPVLLPGIKINKSSIEFLLNEINAGSEVHGIYEYNSKHYIRIVNEDIN